MSELEAWKSLGIFTVLQALLGILIICVGVLGVYLGLREKTTAARSAAPTNGAVPSWALYGPVHDTMEVIRVMAENGREYNRILSRIEEKMNATGKAQWEAVQSLKAIEDVVREKLHQERLQTMLLEDLRNNQVMRPDGTVGIPRRK
jgi:hypothetical protein